MPPSRMGTYSNLTPVRFSIAGMASWLRNALGLPKSNMNCGAVTFMTASQGDIVCPPLWRNASVASTRLNDDRHTLIAGNGPSGPVAVAKGEPHDMVANIVRPGG